MHLLLQGLSKIKVDQNIIRGGLFLVCKVSNNPGHPATSLKPATIPDKLNCIACLSFLFKGVAVYNLSRNTQKKHSNYEEHYKTQDSTKPETTTNRNQRNLGSGIQQQSRIHTIFNMFALHLSAISFVILAVLSKASVIQNMSDCSQAIMIELCTKYSLHTVQKIICLLALLTSSQIFKNVNGLLKQGLMIDMKTRLQLWVTLDTQS